MIRAVIDTNVLVSSLLSPAGNEAPIVLVIHQGLIRPCFSEAMMQEYTEVLARRDGRRHAGGGGADGEPRFDAHESSARGN